MVTPELIEYVKQSRSSGMSDSQIQKALSETGWSVADIDQVLGQNNKAISEPLVPSPTDSTPLPASVSSGLIYGQILLIPIAIVALLPLLYGFLLDFLGKGTRDGLISSYLFIGFVVAYVIKIGTQAFLVSSLNRELRINSANLNMSEVGLRIKKYKNFYPGYYVIHLVLLSGLIPFIHLLTIWAVVPMGFALGGANYAERKFFYDMSKLPNLSYFKILISIALVMFYIFLPLLFLALFLGLNALSF